MSDGNHDLPDDLLTASAAAKLATKAVDPSDEGKVFITSPDDSKDQWVPDSSIPLSPQWLYSKPNDPTKTMPDSNLKEPWRLDSSTDKKDKRKTLAAAADTDSTRRWREEERETTLLSARRDRRKPDYRPAATESATTTRPSPPSEHWPDTTNRNPVIEPRRDNKNSKWSTRWGPDDKDRESRTDKRTPVVDKDDVQNDNQTATTVNNRPPADRESDARDKWRPRHRMEVNSSGPSSYRAAPGFGPDKGTLKGPTMGFTVGRGRSATYVGRGSSIGAAQIDRNNSVPGKPNLLTANFCYPRGKLLDIYRKQKFDSSLTSMPDYPEDASLIAQLDILEPLAFVIPDGEEEIILKDIGKGKITGSEVAYNTLRNVHYESIADTDNFESTNGTINIPSSGRDSVDALRGVANDDSYQPDDAGTLSMERRSRREMEESPESDKFSLRLPTNEIFNNNEIGGSRVPMSFDENGQFRGYTLSEHPKFNEGDSDGFNDRSTVFPNDSDSLLVLSEQFGRGNLQMLEINQQGVETQFEELSLYYLDPQGETQGPFLWDDILSWLEQRFFGTDLPVRFADAPEDTPYQPLGHVISSLKVRGDGFSSGMIPNSILEEFQGLTVHPEASLSASSPLPGTEKSSMHPRLPSLTDFDSLHSQSRISENKGPQQLPHSEGQNFNDTTLDEEIVFHGRPGSAGYQIGNHPRSDKDSLSNSISHHSRINDFSEPVVPDQNNNELHPFGLLRSELEGAHLGHAQSANINSLRRTFGPMADETHADTSTGVYEDNTVSKPGMNQDALGARHASLLQQESTHFDFAEQLMSQQVQQQLMQQQRNALTSHLHNINEHFLDQVPSQNHIPHQQLANHPIQDLEQLYMLQQLQEQRQLQLQEQRQLQLQEQRQLQLQKQQLQQQQLQQQQFHQQQQIHQEQQQAQTRQVLLEQLRHNQMHESLLGQTRGDPRRTNMVLDQILSKQHLREIQQRSHNPSRHDGSSLDHILQAKFGSPQHQNDLYEQMSRAQHGQIRALEHQIRQQEQLQARQLPMGLRQRIDMEEERNIAAAWPVGGDPNQFGRANHAAQQLSGNPLDLYQLQQRIAHEEQLAHLGRNISLQDRILLERSMSLPHGANKDDVHAYARAQVLDRQDSNAHMHSANQMNSGLHSHHSPPLPIQYNNPSHLDTIEGQWPDNNGRMSNDWMDSHIQQSLLNSERQKREAHGKMVSEDPSLWMTESINDEKSKRLLMELLHQKSGQQSTEVLNANSGMSYERKTPSNQSFGPLPDQEVGVNNFYPTGSSGFNLGETQMHAYLAKERQHSEMLQRSNSGIAIQEELLVNHMTPSNTNNFNQLSKEREITEPDGKIYGFKSDVKPKGPTMDVQGRTTEQLRFAAVDHREISTNSYNKNASRSIAGVDAGIFNENVSQTDLVAGDIAKERVPSLLSRGQDNIFLKRPPVHRASASQEGLCELTSDRSTRGKVLSTAGPLERSLTANQSSDSLAPGIKDVRFRRTSSYNDADVTESTSFIDKLKSNNKKPGEATPSELAEGTQGGKSGKKKGKKGRHIDPALLGFKVTSNRIMMGEIQRLDD